MKKFIVLLLVLFCCIPAFSSARKDRTSSPSQIQKKIEKAIQKGQAVQKKADIWTEERAALLSKISEKKNMKRLLEYQVKKYEIYIQKKEAAIENLKKQRMENRKIKMGLEPFLDDLLSDLEKFVEKDIPFLVEERSLRLKSLKETLDDYHADLSEKTARLFEALRIEAGYGGSVDKTEEMIKINGRQTRVMLFRIGRVALFYQTPDKKNMGRFDRQTRTWEKLPDRFNKELGKAIAISDKKRTPSLLDLPIGRFER